MDWQATIAVSEVLGVIGVIVTLVYVGKQLHMSNLAAEAASTDQITHRFLQWMLDVAGDDAVARFFRDGVAALKQSPPSEVMRIFGSIQVLLKIVEEMHQLRVKGFINDDSWSGWENWFSNMKSYDIVELFFVAKQNNYSQSFRTFWNSLPARTDGSLLEIVQKATAASE
jgi:hypothetical protein